MTSETNTAVGQNTQHDTFPSVVKVIIKEVKGNQGTNTETNLKN